MGWEGGLAVGLAVGFLFGVPAGFFARDSRWVTRDRGAGLVRRDINGKRVWTRD